MKKEEAYISLKEASKISGYSSDYIGQLIRSGKLEGKQVYTAVSWVTTEKALRDHFEGSEKKARSLRGNCDLTRIARFVLVAAIIVSAFVVVVLLYLLSLKIERSFEDRGIQQIESAHS